MPRKKAETKAAEVKESKSVDGAISITLSPVHLNQLRIIASTMNNDTIEAYAKKVLQQHIVDRLYLVQR